MGHRIVCTLIIPILFSLNVHASSRDTLKGIEGSPVFSTIYQSNGTALKCYIEYHDYFKEYFNKGTEGYFRTCPNYHFHTKSISNFYTSHIDSMRVGHDVYVRLLKSDSLPGILAKQIIQYPLACYSYTIDDYQDIKLADSLQSIPFSLGIRNNQKTYFIFCLAEKFYIYDFMGIDKIDLPISSNYIQLYTADEVCMILKSAVKSDQQTFEKLCENFNFKNLILFFIHLKHESKQ